MNLAPRNQTLIDRAVEAARAGGERFAADAAQAAAKLGEELQSAATNIYGPQEAAESGPPAPARSSRFPRRLGPALGVAVSLAVFALAAFILFEALSQLKFAELKTAIAQTGAGQIARALFFTAVSYLALTGYDFFALRHVGARAPYRVTALASFASYAASFNLGFPVVTGAAVRYWVYSRAGVTARQVAEVTIIAGVTFWLGMAVALCAGLIGGAPSLPAVDGMPAFVNFMLGVWGLAGVAIYFIWVSLEPRAVILRRHRFGLPGPGVTLAQMALGAADVCCAAAALHALLPAGGGLDFMAFVPVYVAACVLGVVSHAPGGIGVFEATMLHFLPASSPGGVIAALLLFRAFYYFLPFLLALAALGADEGVRRWDALRETIAKIVESRDI